MYSKCSYYLYRYSKATYKGPGINLADAVLMGESHMNALDSTFNSMQMMDDINDNFLRNSLKCIGLRRFIPLKKPSIEFDKNGNISVVYYHNDDLYSTVYHTDPKFIMMPVGPLYATVTDMLENHRLDGWEDERGYAAD